MSVKNLKLADEFAPNYDKCVLPNNWAGPEVIFKLTNKRLKPGSKILDIGIGTGESSKRFQYAGHKITGIDGSKNMLVECKNKGIGEELVLHDLEKTPLPFESGSFDAIISNGVFHLVHPVKPIVYEINRLLRPGGIVAFTFEKPELISNYCLVEKGIWKYITDTEVCTYKHNTSYFKKLLNELELQVLGKKRFLTFVNQEKGNKIYFTAIVAQKLF